MAVDEEAINESVEGKIQQFVEHFGSLENLERELILKALDKAHGNKTQAAKLLGLTRRTLYSRLERYGLSP